MYTIEGSKPRRIGCIYGYEYNYTEYFKSATSQFDWVCQDEWKPAFTQSMFYAGAIIGNLVFFSYEIIPFLKVIPFFKILHILKTHYSKSQIFVQKIQF